SVLPQDIGDAVAVEIAGRSDAPAVGRGSGDGGRRPDAVQVREERRRAGAGPVWIPIKIALIVENGRRSGLRDEAIDQVHPDCSEAAGAAEAEADVIERHLIALEAREVLEGIDAVRGTPQREMIGPRAADDEVGPRAGVEHVVAIASAQDI